MAINGTEDGSGQTNLGPETFLSPTILEILVGLSVLPNLLQVQISFYWGGLNFRNSVIVRRANFTINPYLVSVSHTRGQ